MGVLSLLLLNAAFLLICALALWGLSLRLRDVSFIDSWWPLGMVVLALLSWWRTGGSGPHALALVGICTLWGVRLGAYLYWRWRRQGADPRYTSMIEDAQGKRGWSFALSSLILVFGPQAPLQLMVALPVQLGQVGSTFALGGVAWSGLILALFGVAFEATGDFQLARFKADPANKGRVMDLGLWRYTRHPNYFGEACVWWGLYLIAIETPLGAWSLPGPVIITLLLTKGSGAPTVEGRMRGRGTAYVDYIQRTSGFFPWPPKALTEKGG